MIAGISAFGLIKRLPVSLHLYRNFEHDRTVNTLIPEAMGIMNRWMALNDDSDAHAQQITKQLERPTAPNFDRNLPQLKPARNPERDALLALLQRGEFEMLSRQLANKQVAFEKGLLAESALINAYLAFSSADPGLAKKLDAWIDVQPEHYIPRVARGVYNAHLGWIARGTAYVQKTSYDRLALMVRHFEAATSDFDAALTRNPKISIAWQNLIEMAMARGHPISELYNRGIEEVPSSRVLRGAYAFSFHPDWGGGLEQPWWARWMPGRFREAVTIVIRNMRWLMFHESLQSDSAKFPGLRTVIDSPHYQAAKDASSQADYATAARELIDAVNDGDESRALAEGRQQTAKHNYAAAVRSFDEALREGPSWSDNLKSRANALRGLGYTARSLEAYRLALLDFQQALAVDPYDPELLGDIVMVLWDISTLFPNQASTAFEKLWQDPASCVPHSEPEKRFTVVHMAMPGTPQMTINCTVEALLNRGMFYGRDDFNIREMRGRHYLFAMQSPSRAVKDLAATIEIDDSFPQVWGYYATALHEIGDCRAVAAYQKHIDLCQDGKCPDQLMAISRQRLADLTLSGNCGG